MIRKLIQLSIFALIILLVLSYIQPNSSQPHVKLSNWPPRLNQPFPMVLLKDQDGQLFDFSKYKGKVVLVEMVAMSCEACNAWSGANLKGPFPGAYSQQTLASIEEYLQQYAKIKLDDPRLVFVQIVIYNLALQAPSQEEVTAWAKHFGFEKSKNQFILGATPDMLGQESYDLIPGFQLIDKNLVVVRDATGHHPRHNLFTELLPELAKLLSAAL